MTDQTCSTLSAAVHEPMAGTSPQAVAWLALEQNGPWGARAFTQSHLDPEVGKAIEDTSARFDVRPSLIRCPGRHADPHVAGEPRRVLLGYTWPGRTWLLEGTVHDPAELLDLDWAALRDGDRDAVRRTLPVSAPTDRPHLLVCTNGKRDLCCAVKGRPVALGAAAVLPEQVWEVTHTSGHRFAPTAVLLPAGTLHGRLDAPAAVELLRAAEHGATVVEGSRGRSTWPIAAQAAELAVRQEEAVLDLDALTVVASEEQADGAWSVDLEHVDGRRWRAAVESRASEEERPESCGKALKPVSWLVGRIERVEAFR